MNSALPLKHGMSSHVHASAFEKAIVGHCVGQKDGDTKIGGLFVVMDTGSF